MDRVTLPKLSEPVRELVRRGTYALYAWNGNGYLLVTNGPSRCCNPNGVQKFYVLDSDGGIVSVATEMPGGSIDRVVYL